MLVARGPWQHDPQEIAVKPCGHVPRNELPSTWTFWSAGEDVAGMFTGLGTLSYRSVFLFLCLFWAALRTALFSFYFRDFVAANALRPFVFWLLYCLPVCLQFFTLALLNLYFAQVIFKAKSKYSPELLKYRWPLSLASLSLSLLFLAVNLTCALLVKTGRGERTAVVSVRVAVNDTLFVLCAVCLSVCLYKISKMSLASIYLESKGSSVCQVTAVGVTVTLLYASRACYNLSILAFSQSTSVHPFDYDWYNVSDQADLKNQLGDAGYVVFGVVLFVWELLPTTLVVYFFRVRNPTKDLTSPGIVPSHGFSPRSYFFDNPRRYDSDDDLAWSIASPGLPGSPGLHLTTSCVHKAGHAASALSSDGEGLAANAEGGALELSKL
ncbi:Integral membrane protein GPR137B [Tupaia chinensis]|uniref:Integral membrane protein GPR137B n=1 Tax=Tupaia chinensis TaxID=246437 RepID=L9KZJ6_TUPCH|nr:Integral membrane protein GPR137B [Tupaia chinensis]